MSYEKRKSGEWISCGLMLASVMAIFFVITLVIENTTDLIIDIGIGWYGIMFTIAMVFELLFRKRGEKNESKTKN